MDLPPSELRVLKKRLTQTMKEPSLAFEEGWYDLPFFCEGFFDRCEDEALVIHPQALDLAFLALEMATRNGDPCLVNRAQGLISHAHIARANPFMAGHTLKSYRKDALSCCPSCSSHFLLREGDLLGEERKAAESLVALNHSLKEGGSGLTDDLRARILFPRSIAFHHDGSRVRSIDDAGDVLTDLSLDSPHGFLLDSLALLSVFVGGGNPDDDARALEYIERFEKRLRGVKHIHDVHTRRIWVKAHLNARLGRLLKAARQFSNAQLRLLSGGLLREALAVTLELVLLKCRPGVYRRDNFEAAEKAISKCLSQRQDLTKEQIAELKRLIGVLRNAPRAAFQEVSAFRRSFIAPVACRLEERLVGDQG